MVDIIRPSSIRREAFICIGAGLQVIVSGEAGYDIVVVALDVSANASTQITLQDDTTSLWDRYLSQNQPSPTPQLDPGWIRAATGEDLSLMVQQDATVQGVIIYRMVPPGLEF